MSHPVQIYARIRGVLVCAALLCPALAPGTARAQSTVRSSGEWYAEVLKDRFPSGVPIHGWTHALDELPVHRDITRFDFSAQQTRLAGVDALRIDGSISLGALADPFEAFDGAQGPRYMLHLQAYLFSPSGRLVWQQQGFPAGDAWVDGAGGTVRFTLVGAYSGARTGHELIVIAAGDPILSSLTEMRVLLGAITRTLN